MKEIKGILKTYQRGVGSLSEGPEYWIVPIDDYKNRWEEIIVRKKGMMWQKDPVLHPLIGKTVLIRGDIIETKSTITVDYVEVEEIKE